MVAAMQTNVSRRHVTLDEKIKAIRKLIKGIPNIEMMSAYPKPVEWWVITRRLWYENDDLGTWRFGGAVHRAKRHGLDNV